MKYFEYNADWNEMQYIDNVSIEIDIFITLDRNIKTNGKEYTTGKRLIDTIDKYYRENSVETIDSIRNIIDECSRFSYWQHVAKLAEYTGIIEKNYNYNW